MSRHITPAKADQWSVIANKLRQASELLGECHVLLACDLGITEGKPMEAVVKAEDAVSGLAYMFTPQSEWTGGDSSDPNNFKFRPPHIASS